MQYNYLDMTEMPNKKMTCSRMYCNSLPIVLNINHSFSNFEETITHFNQIYFRKKAKKESMESMGGTGAPPPKYS
jgi:hypothetical protein